MGRIPWDEQKRRREAAKNKHAETRKKFRKFWADKSDRLLAQLRSALGDSGLTKTQLSDFSGADLATLSKLRKGVHKTVRLTTFVSVAEACGYEVKLVEKDPYDDIFRDYRVKKLPPLPKREP